MPISELPTHLHQYLDTTGDGSGTILATGDYSSTSDDFIYQVPSSKIAILQRLIITIGDGSNPRPDRYGQNLIITNGMNIKLTESDDTLITYLGHSNAHPIITNANWASLCYDMSFHTVGSGDNYVMFRWTFSKAGMPLILSDGDKLVITLNDDFTGLTDHRFMVQGLENGDTKAERNRIRNYRFN